MTRPGEQAGTKPAAGHGSRIIGALESAWLAIRDRHPGLPDVVIVTGSGAGQKGRRRDGHHRPARWAVAGAGQRLAPELFIAGELLAYGGAAVLEVLLHEAAHVLAAERGITDASTQNRRYHNRRYLALAAEVGLRGPDTPAPATGWSACLVTAETAFAYRATAAAIDGAALPWLPGEEDPAG